MGRPLSGHLSGHDVEPIPRVDQADVQNEGDERRFIEALSRHFPHVVGDCVGPVGQSGAGLGQRQGRTLGLVEVGRVASSGERVELLFGDPVSLRCARVHVETYGAPVYLAGAGLDQVDGR